MAHDIQITLGYLVPSAFKLSESISPSPLPQRAQSKVDSLIPPTVVK